MNGLDAITFLFVPGSRPDRFDKAAASGADAVILDLEDGVGPADKASARAAVAQYIAHNRALVRVNGFSTPWLDDDLAAIAGAEDLVGVVLPKTDSPDQVAEVAARTGRRVFALVETARGVRDVDRIALVPATARLIFGGLDFALDAGITVRSADEHELLFARSAIVVASRAAGLPGPIDGVQPEIDDDVATTASTRRGADLGFTGKLCLHPRQVPLVRAAFAPTQDELVWARRVLEVASGSSGAAVRVDGAMIDKPRLDLARRIVRASEQPGHQ
jgi:citrate lyase beta subunit